jgi:hypothetical protein
LILVRLNGLAYLLDRTERRSVEGMLLGNENKVYNCTTRSYASDRELEKNNTPF